MTTVKEMTTTRTSEFVEQAETQVKGWVDHFNHLQENLDHTGGSIAQIYKARIADLKSNLNEVEDRLNDLKSSGQDNWNQRRHRFQQASSNYQQSYKTLINDLKEDNRVSADWLEDLTNKSSDGLFGWLEEMIESMPRSEGGKAVYTEN